MKQKLGRIAIAVLAFSAACADGTVTAPTVLDSTTTAQAVPDETAVTTAEPAVTTAEPTTTAPPTTPAPTVPAEPLPRGSFGMAVYQGRANTIAAIEQTAGAQFDIIRWFARWDTPIPNPELNELVRTGHAIHLSFRPRYDDGTNIAWADIAAAQPGDALYQQMEAIIENTMSVGPNVYLTFNHEAETRDSAPNGNAEEFKAAWRVFHKILRDRTGPLTDPSDPYQIATVYTVGNSGFADGRALEFYPGDEYVDVIGADVYNWYTCQGSEREWIQLEDLIVNGVQFARERNKPWAIPEFGSADHPQDPLAKGEWMRNAAITLNSPEWSQDLLFAAYFDVTGAGGTWLDCVWDHNSTPETLEGFNDLLRATSKRG